MPMEVEWEGEQVRTQGVQYKNGTLVNIEMILTAVIHIFQVLKGVTSV